MKKMRVRISAAIVASVLMVSAFTTQYSLASDLQEGEEYQVKAAFIFNFMKFVQWPNGRSRSHAGELVFCTTGKDPFPQSYPGIAGREISGRKVTGRHTTSDALDGCDVLFISESEKAKAGQILRSAHDMNILTISDTEEIRRKGVIINMYIEDRKVRFEINTDSAQKAGLVISSQLLRLSRPRSERE